MIALIFSKQKTKLHPVMIRLLCDPLPFYGPVHCGSPNYTDEE